MASHFHCHHLSTGFLNIFIFLGFPNLLPGLPQPPGVSLSLNASGTGVSLIQLYTSVVSPWALILSSLLKLPFIKAANYHSDVNSNGFFSVFIITASL